ncbi:tRNA lysidine(34) synthetase TilS [Paracoccus contaminans]|uniref:tRNA(Ile)-lysidine synthase n=1 Tax=Paracoccus contaminans TaxID=1945662 RepID=A0A1W6D0P3_9RHOB|nr:tRNA lysidine(34) synthetase TilS [Paracoccus contaminans]ARJ70693.1 tRNA lysidine(34) synthetase TilS [Paracoccus contaminans]
MAPDPKGIVPAELDRIAGSLTALGIAVSGGSDSTALLHIAARWGRAAGVAIEAATVDHALRPGSAAEARAVGQACAGLGVPHAVLTWDHGGRVAGNRMAAARTARMGLLAGWARARGLGGVALGHTQDDQAETLLMRLGRGAGVDGLSAMAARRTQQGTLWLRPMLGMRRAALRAWLGGQGIGWIDDPTNDERAYERVRVRRAIEAADLPVAGIARSAALLAEARAALAEVAAAAAARAQADRGMLRLPAAVLDQPAEIRRRVIVAALRWITGDDYPPRGDEVTRLAETLRGGGQGTLGGALARVRGPWIEVMREPAAARHAALEALCGGGLVWDGRWLIRGLPPGAAVAATGEADLAGREWRAAGLPRLALLSAPAVHLDGAAAVLPLLDGAAGIALRPLRETGDYFSLLRAH